MPFDHAGVLVDDLEGACAFARDVLGLGPPDAEVRVAEHGLSAAFFGTGDGRLELLRFDEPGDRRPGIDHVALEVDDLEATASRLAAAGVRFTGPLRPDPVFAPVDMRGRRHLWTDPATTFGARFQLTERLPATAPAGSVELFACVRVRDLRASLPWYEQLLGPAAFWPHDREVVFTVAPGRHLVAEEVPDRAGGGLATLVVDDLDGWVAAAAARGLSPTERETYGNGVRKAVYRDADGNEFGLAGAPA